MALLEVEELTVSYGGVRAVDHVSLTVDTGQLVGLIGPNGAGKTSLIDGLTGFTPATGAVRFDGVDLAGRRPSQRAHHGLARTFQAGELFEDLTVQENLVAASHANSLWRMLRDLVRPSHAVDDDRIDAALDNVGLAGLGDHMPSELSQGQMKLVALARAQVSQPRCALLDEPAAGLDSTESLELGALLRRLTDDGLGVLLVDHDMDLVFTVCDWIYVVDFGRLIAQGPPAELRHNEDVIAAYLGASAQEASLQATNGDPS